MLTHGLLDLAGITAYRFRYLVGNRICRLCAARYAPSGAGGRVQTSQFRGTDAETRHAVGEFGGGEQLRGT